MKKLKEGLLIFLNGSNCNKMLKLISDSLEFNKYKRPYLYLNELAWSDLDIQSTLSDFLLEGEIVLVAQSEPKMWELVINKYHYNVKDRNVFCIAWANNNDNLRESTYNLNYSKFNIISEDENYIANAIIEYIEYNILPENIE